MRTYFHLANDIIDAINNGDSECLLDAANEAYARGFLRLADIAREGFDIATGAAHIDRADTENALLIDQAGFAIEAHYRNF